MAISLKEYNLLAQGVKSQKLQCIRVPLEATQAGWPMSYVILHLLSPLAVRLLFVTCAWGKSFLKRRKFCFGSFFHRFQSKETSLITVSLRYDRLCWWGHMMAEATNPMATRKEPHSEEGSWELGGCFKGFSYNALSPIRPTSLQPFNNESINRLIV